jgi:glycosyltransferase involved in cell wall biosynthesis
LRRLLVLTYHFPPSSASGTFRTLGFARHLPRYGWETVVVAPPSLPWEPDDFGLLEQVPVETVVVPVPYRRGSLAQRLAPFSVWLPKALAASRRAIRDYHPEAVLTSGPPHQIHLLGLVLSRRYGLRWIADFRDPWVADGRQRAGPTWRSYWAARLERTVVERADAILANAPRACAAVTAAYPEQRHKMITLCNGYDPESFDIPLAPPSHEPRAPIEVVHAGALYGGRDPRPFLDAVAALARSPRDLPRPLRVLLLGPSPEDNTLDLRHEIALRGLEDVVAIGGQVPYAQAVAAMMRAHVLLLIDSPGRRVGVPAKLYEYVGAGRPILALGERGGDLAWALGASGTPHRIAAPTDPTAIRHALVDLARQPVTVGRSTTEDHPRLGFSREALAGQLAEVLDRCNIGPAPGSPPLSSSSHGAAALTTVS